MTAQQGESAPIKTLRPSLKVGTYSPSSPSPAPKPPVKVRTSLPSTQSPQARLRPLRGSTGPSLQSKSPSPIKTGYKPRKDSGSSQPTTTPLVRKKSLVQSPVESVHDGLPEGGAFPEIVSVKDAPRARWAGEEDWELRTETVGMDEDGETSVAAHHLSHTRQLQHYKTLLVRAQSASSASIHDLHSKLVDIENRYSNLLVEHAQCSAKLAEEVARARESKIGGVFDKSTLLGLVGNMGRDERINVLGAIAEACHPSDIAAQIAILEKYRHSRLDILGRLGHGLAAKVLSFLEVKDVLNIRLVCKRYAQISQLPAVWKVYCQILEYTKWGGNEILAMAEPPEFGWENLYKSLWRREKNWNLGLAQKALLLKGHTNFVTSLKLRGDTLISGSYDETIRVWHLPHLTTLSGSIRSSPIVLPAKSVSCLDYLPSHQVFVAGSHDIGRVQVWRKNADGWEVLHILQGHLHGIRAVAINDEWLVSAGADKALVVWDWRNGQKIVRFGQQTNICLGIQLLHSQIVSVTVDGVIRTFCIAKRQMIAQFRIADLGKMEGGERLRGVGSGTAGGMTWLEGEGRFMTCATREIIVRLEWDEEEVEIAVAKDIDDDHKSVATTSRTSGMSRTPSKPPKRSVSNPIIPQIKRNPSLPPLTWSATNQISPILSRKVSTASLVDSAVKKSPFSPSQPNLAAISAHNATSSSPVPVRDPRAPGSSPSISSTRIGSKTTSNLGRSTITTGILQKANSDSLSSSSQNLPDSSSKPPRRALLPNLSRPPTVKEIIEAPDVERGAMDSGRNRIVTTTRFALRTGADRHVYISSPREEGKTDMIPIKGAWAAVADEMHLQTPEKNPMSLVIDREKFAYGCTDGTIVLVGFVGTEYE